MYDFDTYTDILNCVLYTIGKKHIPAKPLRVLQQELSEWEANIWDSGDIADADKADAIRLLHSYVHIRKPNLFDTHKPALFLALPSRELYQATNLAELKDKVGKHKLYKLKVKQLSTDTLMHVGYKSHGGWQYFCIDYVNH